MMAKNGIAAVAIDTSDDVSLYLLEDVIEYLEENELANLQYRFDNGAETSVVCVLRKILDGIIYQEFGLPKEVYNEFREEKKFSLRLGEILEMTAEWIDYYGVNKHVFIREQHVSSLMLEVADSIEFSSGLSIPFANITKSHQQLRIFGNEAITLFFPSKTENFKVCVFKMNQDLSTTD